MYTVVIADDEEELRKAIMCKVDWESLGFRIVADAENGVEALELVENLEPDLLITDIKMPMLSGLELAGRVREVCPATQIVILSGYDEFEYAQKAIQYNIIRYLLKPISAQELSSELAKIRDSMDERLREIRGNDRTDYESVVHRLSVTDFLMPLLLGNPEEAPNEAELRDTAQHLGLVDEGGESFVVIVSKFKGSDGKYCTSAKHTNFVGAVLDKYFKTESFFVSGRIVTFAVTSGDFMEQLQIPLKELVQSASMVFEQKCTVGVSRAVDRLGLCSNAYFEAVTARRYTTDGAGDVRFIDDQEHGISYEYEYVEKSVFKLEQLLKVGKRDSIEAFLGELYEEENKNSIDYLVIQVMATVLRAVSTVSDRNALGELMAENPIYSKATLYDHEENIRLDLINLCVNARDIISRYQKQDSEVLCDKVQEIIDTEYGSEELSLADISTRLSVSPNYLSSLIKKTKKENFVSLLTRRRMEKAYDLLMCTQNKVLEIAEKCGYSDQHYFSYCFKKYYGVSPNKMRETGRG